MHDYAARFKDFRTGRNLHHPIPPKMAEICMVVPGPRRYRGGVSNAAGSMHNTLSVGWLLLGVSAAVARPATGQACDDGPLVLDARASLLLPANFGIQGVAPDPSGGVTLWAADGTVLAIDRGHRLSQRHLPDSLRPAGMGHAADGLRLLDAITGREYRLGEDGVPVRLGQVSIGPGEVLEQAYWDGSAWVLALRQLAARRFVVRREDAAGSHALFRTPAADSVPAIPRYQLSGSPAGLLLTHVTTPFEVIRISAGRTDTLPLPLGGGHRSLIPAESLSVWRALPAVGLECALLLTLTDLTTDHRLLVRYSAEDRLERVTPVDAPFGLIAPLPARRLLAARRAGELELVWYDWRRVREPGSPAR